jgi:exodeoxyribonuclease VII large subunit
MTLQELNRLVRSNLRQYMPDAYWVQAEVSECKEHFSGHCYLELIQKKEGEDTLCAKARATIWANTWQTLGAYFAEQTGTRLKPGLQILAEVAVDFHELYGFSLVVKDIDPSYTLGDQAMRRREILKRLETEGVIDQNKELAWPEIPRRIAVISSPGAAGYQDFMHQLTENEYGFVFYAALFPATMQGQGAASSIMNALDRIVETALPFDVVVIIRGGGAVADLSCFDEYDLCYFATQYPLPLLTGLGHDKDNAILDRVAHTSVKTPTAAAEKLLDTLLERAGSLDENAERLMRRVNQVLEAEKLSLHTMPGRLVNRVQDRLMQAKIKVEQEQSGLREQAAHALQHGRQQNTLFATRLTLACKTAVTHQSLQVRLLEQSVNSFSPTKMLERGFSLTLHQGKPLRSVKDLKEGTTVETRLADGHFTSTVQSKHQHNER